MWHLWIPGIYFTIEKNAYPPYQEGVIRNQGRIQHGDRGLEPPYPYVSQPPQAPHHSLAMDEVEEEEEEKEGREDEEE